MKRKAVEKSVGFQYKNQTVVAKGICRGPEFVVAAGNSMAYGVTYYEFVKLDK